MLTFTVATLTLLVAFPDPDPVELFAKEGWYKDAKGAEVEFVGVLRKAKQDDNVVGFGRNNPFRLEMDGNKVREVHVGGNLKILDPYVGKKIKLVGKAVDMEVEGRNHKEIWPASLVVLADDKKDAGKGDAPKIHAKAPSHFGKGGSSVIRTADDKATAELAKRLKVDGIDWKKQMVIVISGGQQRTGGYSVEAKSLEVKDKKLVVHWKLNVPDGIVTQVISHPALTILVDRFEGDVVFDPAPPPEKKRGQ
jgi:PrcB C-terminal